MRGYPIPQSKNPKRPVASCDRYLKIREHADQVDPQRLFGSFMDLIEALGWRVTAIRELLASDVDLVNSPKAPHGGFLAIGPRYPGVLSDNRSAVVHAPGRRTLD